MRHEHRRASGPHLLFLLGMAAATLSAGHPEAGEPPYAPDASMATMPNVSKPMEGTITACAWR